jgi:2,3-bisphosphoglycerate-dependent phosphoglycerate mutase
MPRLVLLRHGESAWNLQGRFTGWVDVDLTPEGEAQARRAGALMVAEGLMFDRAFASVLRRAIRTACLALDAADQLWIPLSKDWRLNERHYGALTGLNKQETADEHGADQVMIWRRSYDVAPPPLAPGGPYDFAADRRYAGQTPPTTESLKTTLERVVPFWNAALAPALANGDTVLVTAHGNSIRAIVKHLFGLNEAEIVKLEIPTGNPMVVSLTAALSVEQARYLDANRAEALPEKVGL